MNTNVHFKIVYRKMRINALKRRWIAHRKLYNMKDIQPQIIQSNRVIVYLSCQITVIKFN